MQVISPDFAYVLLPLLVYTFFLFFLDVPGLASGFTGPGRALILRPVERGWMHPFSLYRFRSLATHPDLVSSVIS